MQLKVFVVLSLVVFLCSGLAHAVPRYLVEDSSNVIKAYTEDDSLIAPPGHTAVDASVIEAAYSGTIYQGGTWDGTTYTPPTGSVTEIDGTTDIGGVKVSCINMLDVFDQALDYIHNQQVRLAGCCPRHSHRWNPLADHQLGSGCAQQHPDTR